MWAGPPIGAERATAAIVDAYALLRVLLAERGPDDRGLERRTTASSAERSLDVPGAALWAELPAEAEHHGVTPLIEPMLTTWDGEPPAAVPDDVRRSFRALASRHRAAARTRESCIDRLLTELATADVQMLLLKGAALAHRIYPSPDLRPMLDIDILIDPADTERAVSVARDLGYVFADGHGSPFAGRMHHLPQAVATQSGFRIVLEIHLDTMSPNQSDTLTLSKLTAKPQPFARGAGPAGLAFGHTDMLRHLARHAFEPARRIRLIHLYDLWRYRAAFRDEIDWHELEARFPHVIVALRLVEQVFANALSATSAGAGHGMVPLSEIAAADMSPLAKLTTVFDPPAWWLHGFYGVPPERSLFVCRTVQHPATVVRWLLARSAAAMASRRDRNRAMIGPKTSVRGAKP
jgi:hypothetical protein